MIYCLLAVLPDFENTKGKVNFFMSEENFGKSYFTFLRNGLKIFCLTVIVFLTATVETAAQEEVIWLQSVNFSSFSDFGPSRKAGNGQYTLDSELADDININGTISRVDVTGYTNGPTSVTPASSHYHGVNVRFYAFGADSKPGALQAEYFIPKNSPNLLFHSTGLGDLRVRLEPAFQATGRPTSRFSDRQAVCGMGRKVRAELQFCILDKTATDPQFRIMTATAERTRRCFARQTASGILCKVSPALARPNSV
jgi:hypothetical protein